MRVLLVSTYELGHQPLHVADPAGALLAAGHDVTCVDTSVQPWDETTIDGADAVAFSVPMHTAMRLTLPLAAAAKRRRPDLPICFYGLYAPVSSDLTVGRVADRVIAGQYRPALVAWVEALAGRGRDSGTVVHLDRDRGGALPARHHLPPLERYAHLAVGGEERPVGYVEATTGCLHECRHCPVPTVYGGRFRAVDRGRVLSDVAQLVEMGARHITFGDPDFLNGPTHAVRIVTAMHERWPWLTFDVTTKVSHILAHRGVWPVFADAGCLFVVTALETTNDAILARLDKGHTTAEAAAAVALLRDHGIEPRPSWLPFTPWTTLDDVADILAFVVEHDLVYNVDPVQYTIRLLLPEGSLLLDDPALRRHLGPYDPEGLSYRWWAADPRVDALQAELARIVASGVDEGVSTEATFLDVNAAVAAAAGRALLPASALQTGSTEGRPRLTEPWFC